MLDFSRDAEERPETRRNSAKPLQVARQQTTFWNFKALFKQQVVQQDIISAHEGGRTLEGSQTSCFGTAKYLFVQRLSKANWIQSDGLTFNLRDESCLMCNVRFVWGTQNLSQVLSTNPLLMTSPLFSPSPQLTFLAQSEADNFSLLSSRGRHCAESRLN